MPTWRDWLAGIALAVLFVAAFVLLSEVLR